MAGRSSRHRWQDGGLDLVASRKQPPRLLFTDIRAAYYRAWSEHALDPLVDSGIRASWMTSDEIQAHERLRIGVPKQCRHLKTDRHKNAHIGMREDGGAIVVVAHSSLRLGDAFAGLVFVVVRVGL